jgi:hypothetical protein
MTIAPTPVPGRPSADRGPWLVLAILGVFAVLTLTVILLASSGAFRDSSTTVNGSVEGSGIAASQTRDVAPFAAVALTGADNVSIRIGKPQAVVVRGDVDVLDRVTTRVQEGRLVIGTTGSFTSKTGMKVDLTVPSLSELSLVGNGVIAVKGIDTASLTVTLSGSGVIRASGRASGLDVTLSGAGDVRLGALVASNVSAALDGVGRIAVTATKSLHASVSGAGSIVYGGNPSVVTRSVTGHGTVTSR